MVIAKHDRVDEKDDAVDIQNVLQSASKAEVVSVDEKTWEDEPPAPLNLPWSQRNFPGSPSQVLDNLQTLYNSGYTTYPRTENQKYEDDFDFFMKIVALGTNSPIDVPDFGGNFDPTEGGKFDPAHPPITPTEKIPDFNQLDKWERITYIRVARHFLATLMDPAVKRKVTYVFDVDGHEFKTECYSMVEMGYFEVYSDYKKVYSDKDLGYSEGDVVDIKDWELEEEETDPPDLWSSSKIIQKMENQNLGTSATRGSMVDKIQTRGYANQDEGLESTRLGDNVIEALNEYAPMITDPSFTAEMTKNLQKLRNGNLTYDEVVEEAMEQTSEALIEVKRNEEQIGEEMAKDKEACPDCGGDLELRGNDGDFFGCSNYFDDEIECGYTESV